MRLAVPCPGHSTPIRISSPSLHCQSTCLQSGSSHQEVRPEVVDAHEHTGPLRGHAPQVKAAIGLLVDLRHHEDEPLRVHHTTLVILWTFSTVEQACRNIQMDPSLRRLRTPLQGHAHSRRLRGLLPPAGAYNATHDQLSAADTHGFLKMEERTAICIMDGIVFTLSALLANSCWRKAHSVGASAVPCGRSIMLRRGICRSFGRRLSQPWLAASKWQLRHAGSIRFSKALCSLTGPR